MHTFQKIKNNTLFLIKASITDLNNILKKGSKISRNFVNELLQA